MKNIYCTLYQFFFGFISSGLFPTRTVLVMGTHSLSQVFSMLGFGYEIQRHLYFKIGTVNVPRNSVSSDLRHESRLLNA